MRKAGDIIFLPTPSSSIKNYTDDGGREGKGRRRERGRREGGRKVGGIGKVGREGKEYGGSRGREGKKTENKEKVG